MLVILLRLIWKSSNYCNYYKVVAQWNFMSLNLCLFFLKVILPKINHQYVADLQIPESSGTEMMVLPCLVTECNVLDNNPASFFLTNSNRNLMYQHTQVLSGLKICFISEVGGHYSEVFCNLEMEGLEWL